MAISTYAELQTAIGNWTDRTDLTSRIPEFISLAEGRINRRLRTKEMESVTSGETFTSGTDSYALPTNAVAITKFVVTAGGEETQLDQMSKTLLHRKFPLNTPDIPSAFAIDGNQLVVRATPDDDYAYEVSYYEGLDIATDSTNWLLTRFPDVYVAGALLEASIYLKDREDLVYWEGRFESALREVETMDNKDRWNGGTLSIRRA